MTSNAYTPGLTRYLCRGPRGISQGTLAMECSLLRYEFYWERCLNSISATILYTLLKLWYIGKRGRGGERYRYTHAFCPTAIAQLHGLSWYISAICGLTICSALVSLIGECGSYLSIDRMERAKLNVKEATSLSFCAAFTRHFEFPSHTRVTALGRLYRF